MHRMDALKKLFESKFRLSSEKVLFANSVNELIYFIPDVLKPKRVLVVGLHWISMKMLLARLALKSHTVLPRMQMVCF